MAETYAGVCLLCGRTLGYTVHGAFYTAPGGRRPERDGRTLRCGYCHGGVMFKPTPPSPVTGSPRCGMRKPLVTYRGMQSVGGRDSDRGRSARRVGYSKHRSWHAACTVIC